MMSPRLLARRFASLADRWIPAQLQADADTHRRARLLLGVGLVPVPALLGFALAYAWTIPEGPRELIVFPILGAALFCASSAPVLYHIGSLVLALRLAFGPTLCTMLAFAMVSGGSHSHALFWGPILPSVAYLIGGRREGLIWWLAVMGLYSGFLVWDTPGMAVAPQVFERSETALAESLALLALVLTCFVLFERTKEGAGETLRAARGALIRAQEDAARASHAKSRFLSRMSHRIRTPLMAILGFTDLLLDAETCSEPERESLRAMKRSGAHLLHIVDEMLDLSRIESDALEIAAVPLDPLELAREVVEGVRARAEGKGVALELQTQGALPALIRGDPTRLRQSLLNLAANAVKFTPPGGRVVLGLEARAEPPERIRFSVTDTGIGMTAEELTRLFQPFVQASASTARLYGGTGLGLVISRQLVEAMGGSIRVESHPGTGTRFDVELPVGEIAQGAAAAVAVSGEHALRVERSILVVDDTLDNRRLLERLLMRAGARVSVASGGLDALEQVQAAAGRGESFELILMDLQMPDLDGYETLLRLRARGFAGRVVALTADAMLQTRERCLRAGFDGYATKPIDRRKLLQIASEDGTSASEGLRPAPGSGAAEPPELEHGGWARLVAFFLPPALRDSPDAFGRAQMVIGVALTPVPLLPPLMALVAHIFPPEIAQPMWAGMLLTLPLCGAVPALMRLTGSIGIATHAAIVHGAVLITWAMAVSGGIRSFLAPWPLIFPVIALAILGRRSCMVWGAVSAGVMIGFTVLEPLFAIHLPSYVQADSLTLAYFVTCSLFVSWLLCLALIFDTAKSGTLRRLERANSDVAAARDRAERASLSKGRFLASLSHEMRTPMTAILGFADLLQEAWQQRPDLAEARGSLRGVQRNSRALLRLIHDLLELSKLEAGRLQVERLVFSPQALLEDVVHAAHAEAESRGIALVAQIAPGLRGVRVHDDSTRIAEILGHLVDNAVQWSGGRRVRVALEACMSVDAAGEELCWSVEDDGHGMADAMLARVLEGGEALSESSQNTGSAGLGFPLCRRLCAALGGRLSVRSTAGGGTRVFVHLPRLPLPADAAGSLDPLRTPASERVQEGSGSVRGRVLLVEDSPDNQRLLAHLLRASGAQVDIAADGLAALERVQRAECAEDPYAIVLMDMQMPVMDGAAATRALRARGFALPILALTAQTVAEARESCLQAGCDDVASKPIERRRLIAAVTRLIDAHAEKRHTPRGV